MQIQQELRVAKIPLIFKAKVTDPPIATYLNMWNLFKCPEGAVTMRSGITWELHPKNLNPDGY